MTLVDISIMKVYFHWVWRAKMYFQSYKKQKRDKPEKFAPQFIVYDKSDHCSGQVPIFATLPIVRWHRLMLLSGKFNANSYRLSN